VSSAQAQCVGCCHSQSLKSDVAHDHGERGRKKGKSTSLKKTTREGWGCLGRVGVKERKLEKHRNTHIRRKKTENSHCQAHTGGHTRGNGWGL